MNTEDRAKARAKLSYRQVSELDSLAKNPTSYFGSCTNSTMNALKKRGLVDIEWSEIPGSPYRKEKWVITVAGRAMSSTQP
jgi:hypothetical protein